jgi:hypothetical protein
MASAVASMMPTPIMTTSAAAGKALSDWIGGSEEVLCVNNPYSELGLAIRHPGSYPGCRLSRQ